MNKKRIFGLLTIVAIVVCVAYYGSDVSAQRSDRTAAVPESNTPQTLPFSQNWANAGLITASDDWSGVPGVIGYRGDDLTIVTGTDPRTILADGSATPVDVNANQTNPDTFTTGGVAEFDTLANPAVALNGSGTADAPHIVVHLNTTGQSNISFACNLRDLDATADDAAMQVDVQVRVGGTGSYASVTGGYFPDVTTASTATQVTAVNVTLPASADNQALVEVRVITTNAVGNDEWVGVDDISVTGTPTVVNTQHMIDYDGNGRTDFSVVRNTGGGPTGQITWFNQLNGGAGTHTITPWGIVTDFFVPGNYDGDDKTDIAVWRPGPPTVAAFYILQSATSTVRIEQFGQTGDDPTIVGDYNGDGHDDPATYRAGAASGDQSFWYWRQVAGGDVFVVPWGQNGDFPAPGDYDGNGSNDCVIQRNNGGGQAIFWTRLSTTGAISSTIFGTPTDVIVPGDYDGDGKTDIAVIRGIGGQINWFVLPSSGGAFTTSVFGLSADFTAQGDYDGDGKTDVAVWRPSADPTQNFFYVLGSTAGFSGFEWGQNGDYPVADYNSH